MTKSIELIHPELGLVAQENVRRKFTERRIKDTWMKKYGKSKYDECLVKLIESKNI